MRGKKIRYLVVGCWNALFSYGVTVFLYFIFSGYLHIVVISTMANVIAITMSFTTNKIFVFRNKGHWWVQYFRSYVVYGGNILFGIFGLWLLSGCLAVPVWLAQAFLVLVGVIIAYFGHKEFTFRNG